MPQLRSGPGGPRRPGRRLIPAGDSAISWHLFDRATFSIGRDAIDIPGASMPIGIYSAERCIVDAFRLRGDVGYQLGRDALRE
jgi:hypothetical protein